MGRSKNRCKWGVIEQLLEEKDLVCLNDGRRTRLDVHTGNMSVLDLTSVSNNLAGKCDWEVTYETTGSDHYPVFCRILIQENKQQGERMGKWIFDRAKWEMFSFICENEMDNIDLNEDIEEIVGKLEKVLLEAAN